MLHALLLRAALAISQVPGAASTAPPAVEVPRASAMMFVPRGSGAPDTNGVVQVAAVEVVPMTTSGSAAPASAPGVAQTVPSRTIVTTPAVTPGMPALPGTSPVADAPAPEAIAPPKAEGAPPLAPEMPKLCADDKNGDDKNENGNGDDKCKEKKEHEKKEGHLLKRIWGYYCDAFTKTPEEEEPAKRGPCTFPEPWSSPPFPMHEFQGYPLPGVPPESERYPLTEALQDGPFGDFIKESRLKLYGWVTGSWNDSTNKNSNAPTSYWVVPNRLELDQVVFRLEREPDLAQNDHMDIGFRSTIFYGMDYRYTFAGGWSPGDVQFQKHNDLYGWDPLEQYVDWWIPMQGCCGLVVRVGRWVACPDIETQLAPDNYLGSHSILFTYDTYTQTGVMLTQKLNKNLIVQVGINAGNDMAPWYKGATPCGYAAIRYVFNDNKNAVYTVLNQVDTAQGRRFDSNGLPLFHDNFNYEVTSFEHVITKNIHTKFESYFMWEENAIVGGTSSNGPVKSFGGGGGNGADLPGLSKAYGVLNYTMFAIPKVYKDDFLTIRNEWWRDETGFRSGFRDVYSSHTVGWTHNFNKVFQMRPEVGYYRAWNQPAFDLGAAKGCWIAAVDYTLRF